MMNSQVVPSRDRSGSSSGTGGGSSNVMHLLHDMETFISDYDAKEDHSNNSSSSSSSSLMQLDKHPQPLLLSSVPSTGSMNGHLKRKVSEREDKGDRSAITAFLLNQLDSASTTSKEQERPRKQQRRRQQHHRSSSTGDVLLKSMDSDNSPLVSEIESMAGTSWSRSRRVSSSEALTSSSSDLEPLPIHQPAGSNHRRGLSAPSDALTMSQQSQSLTQTTSSTAAAAAAASSSAPQNKSSAASAAATVDHQGDTKTYLHRVCRHFSSQKDVVEIALALDPEAVRRKGTGATAPTTTTSAASKTASNKGNNKARTLTTTPSSIFLQNRVIQERYSYPINIAIQNKAGMDVLELLVNHGPDVLVQKDGYERTGSLSVALNHKPNDLDLMDLILFANLQGIMVTDRKLNYPLHTACAKGASVEVIKRLHTHYPAALFQQNFNSETPLDIARRSTLIDEAAFNYLQEQFMQGCLKVARTHHLQQQQQQQQSAATAVAAAPDVSST